MKKIRNIFAALVIVYVSLALLSGCETSITQIVPYSGYWKVSFSNTNGSVIAKSVLTIQDTGAFCGKFTGSDFEFFVQGDVNADGEISGKFSTSCSGSVSGNMSGYFSEIMGAGYASGTFTDTVQNPAFKGTWEARRN